MSKFYSQPEYEIRKYCLTQDVFTNSPGSLDDDDEFGKNSGGAGTNSIVNNDSFAG